MSTINSLAKQLPTAGGKKAMTQNEQRAIDLFKAEAKRLGGGFRDVCRHHGQMPRYLDHALRANAHSAILRFQGLINIPPDLLDWAEDEAERKATKSRQARAVTRPTIASPIFPQVHWPVVHI